MKGICHRWSRGRHFSPSLPDDRYLKLSSQKRSPGRNLGEHRLVRRSGTASRGTVLLNFSSRMRRFRITDSLTTWVGKPWAIDTGAFLIVVNALNSLKGSSMRRFLRRRCSKQCGLNLGNNTVYCVFSKADFEMVLISIGVGYLIIRLVFSMFKYI